VSATTPESSILPTYMRTPVAFEKGEGAWLTDSNGVRYLDFGAGIAVASVGHCHPHIVQALMEQGSTLACVQSLPDPAG
jgi:acetylornithine/N-succinyldiaminopimelate aminotransferase